MQSNCFIIKTLEKDSERLHYKERNGYTKIYCDGCCLGNPGPGGWAAIFIRDEIIGDKVCGSESFTTNNRMELVAAINSLKLLYDEGYTGEIAVFTDSKYLKLGITEWIKSWKKTEWKKGKIKNIELWKELDALVLHLHVTWNWVKAHSGDFFNEMVDKLAKKAAKGQIDG